MITKREEGEGGVLNRAGRGWKQIIIPDGNLKEKRFNSIASAQSCQKDKRALFVM